MAVRLLTMSKSAPSRTWVLRSALPMMKFGSFRTGPCRKTAGIELMKVSRYRTPATNAVFRIAPIAEPLLVAAWVLSDMSVSSVVVGCALARRVCLVGLVVLDLPDRDEWQAQV